MSAFFSRTLLERSNTTSVDLEAGIIRDVKICGLSSQNGYEYDPKGLEAAVSLYEGRQIFCDHPPSSPSGDGVTQKVANGTRSVSDLTAVIFEVRFVSGDGLRGNLRVIKESNFGPQLLEMANDPVLSKSICLSHNADPTAIDTRNDRAVVRGIAKVNSVDLVTQGGTTSSLYESKRTQKGKPMNKTAKTVLEAVCGLGAKKQIKLLETMGAPINAPVQMESEEVGHEEQAKAAFQAMCSAVLEDETVSDADKVKRIKDILGAKAKLLGSEEKTATEEEKSDDEKKVTEEEKPAEGEKKVAESAKTLDTRKVIESAAKFKITDPAVIGLALEQNSNESAIRLLETIGRNSLGNAEQVKSYSGGGKPTSAVPDKYDDFVGERRHKIAFSRN